MIRKCENTKNHETSVSTVNFYKVKITFTVLIGKKAKFRTRKETQNLLSFLELCLFIGHGISLPCKTIYNRLIVTIE